MIVDERIITFINSFETQNSEILETIEKEALASRVPIIRKEMQSFLKVLLTLTKPKKVLEVGTAVGFSALLMSEYTPADCRITTIENWRKADSRWQRKTFCVQDSRIGSFYWKAMLLKS